MATGLPTDRIAYSSYGMTTYRAGTTDTPFLYNGRYGVMTDANGLLYMQARYYNPYICRFINPDPSGFGGGLNWYAYAGGDPVSMVDPFGLGAVEAATGSSWLSRTLQGTAVGDWARGFSSGLQSYVNGEDLSRYTPYWQRRLSERGFIGLRRRAFRDRTRRCCTGRRLDGGCCTPGGRGLCWRQKLQPDLIRLRPALALRRLQPPQRQHQLFSGREHLRTRRLAWEGN